MGSTGAFFTRPMQKVHSPQWRMKSPPSILKGVIKFANHKIGRYAVSMGARRYTIFQVLSAGAPLNVGETMGGELEALTVQIYDTSRHGKIRVFVEEACCTRSTAQAWVRSS